MSLKFHNKNIDNESQSIKYLVTKGLLILKGLFANLEFFQKVNKTIQVLLRKKEFVCSFFVRIVGLKKILRLFLTFSVKSSDL